MREKKSQTNLLFSWIFRDFSQQTKEGGSKKRRIEFK